MLKKIRVFRRHRKFQWKPAIDLSDPKIVAALTTFPAN